MSRRAGSREDIADGMVIAIAEVLFSLANDLSFDAGGKTSGTRTASGSLNRTVTSGWRYLRDSGMTAAG